MQTPYYTVVVVEPRTREQATKQFSTDLPALFPSIKRPQIERENKTKTTNLIRLIMRKVSRSDTLYDVRLSNRRAPGV